VRISIKQAEIYRNERLELVSQLKQKGIKSESVLEAISLLPRELFIPKKLHSKAYEDNALPIDYGQTISQPYTVAYMTELLDVIPEMKVLEIGTGSGYQASLLYMLKAKVFSIERIPELYYNVKTLFNKLNLDIFVKLDDGTLGWEQSFLYDRIIITAAAPELPQSLLKQLTIGGKLVVPIGDKKSQTMTLIERTDEKNFRKTEKLKFRFVPLIGEEGWKESDVK